MKSIQVNFSRKQSHEIDPSKFQLVFSYNKWSSCCCDCLGRETSSYVVESSMLRTCIRIPSNIFATLNTRNHITLPVSNLRRYIEFFPEEQKTT